MTIRTVARLLWLLFVYRVQCRVLSLTDKLGERAL